MATNSVCAPCLRTLRRTARAELRVGNVHPAHHQHTTRSRTQPPALILQQRHQCRSRAFSTHPPRPAGQSPTPGSYESGAAPSDSSALAKFAKGLRAQETFRAATEPYVAYGSTTELFRVCAAAGEYSMPAVAAGAAKRVTATGEEVGVGSGWWYDDASAIGEAAGSDAAPGQPGSGTGGLGLMPTFNTWAQITMLHMWLLTVRLRLFPADHAKHWHQFLLDHFFYAAEDRMASLHGIEARSVRNRYLKDLFVQWRGVLAAYDEGLIKGDAVMASAVWRNVFQGSEDVDAVGLAQIVAWMYKTLQELGRAKDVDVANANIEFAHPGMELQSVSKKSKQVGQPL